MPASKVTPASASRRTLSSAREYGGISPATPSRGSRSQPAYPGVAERLSEPRVPDNCRATPFAKGVLDGGQRRTDHDSGLGHAVDQGVAQLGVRGNVGHYIDTGGHDLLDADRRAHVSDDD